MKDSWQNIADILAEPSAAFARLKSEPKWLLAMVIFLSVLYWDCIRYVFFYRTDHAPNNAGNRNVR